MNGHIVIPHRSHFTWKRTELVIRQDFAGLQLAVLELPATAVQRERERETTEVKIQGLFIGLHENIYTFVKINFRTTALADIQQRTRMHNRSREHLYDLKGKLLRDVWSGGTITRRLPCSI